MIEWNEWIIYCATILILLAGMISLVSLIRFPSILIKLIIIEVLTNLLMASIALWALIYNQPIFIDICLPIALIMFLGMVAYYQFLFGKENDNVDLHR